MKSSLSDIERLALQEKIVAGLPPGMPAGAFVHPRPEFFLGEDTGILATGHVTSAHDCPMHRFVELHVLAVSNPAGIHILGKFRYN